MKKTIIILSIITSTVLIVIYLFRKYGFMNKLTKRFKYFDLKEFDSRALASDLGDKYTKNGKLYLVDSGKDNMDMTFVKKLDNARNIIEKEWNKNNPDNRIIFRINSGYRTQVYNDTLSGSVTNSSHITGLASDVSLSGYTDEQIKIILNALVRVGLNRFGMGKTYVHVDNDKSKTNPTVWNYGIGSISIDPFTA